MGLVKMLFPKMHSKKLTSQNFTKCCEGAKVFVATVFLFGFVFVKPDLNKVKQMRSLQGIERARPYSTGQGRAASTQRSGACGTAATSFKEARGRSMARGLFYSQWVL